MSWLSLSPIVVMGALDRARIEPRIEALRPQLQACITEAPPDALTMRLVFGRAGLVVRVTVRDGSSTPVSDCFSDALQTLTVPHPRCGCSIIIVDQPIAWGPGPVALQPTSGDGAGELNHQNSPFFDRLLMAEAQNPYILAVEPETRRVP